MRKRGVEHLAVSKFPFYRGKDRVDHIKRMDLAEAWAPKSLEIRWLASNLIKFLTPQGLLDLIETIRRSRN